MVKKSVAEALLALAKSDQHRSETARLRDVIDEIEIALQAGVSRAAVLATLHAQGFTLSPRSFESALYRIRQQRRKITLTHQQAVTQVADTNQPTQPPRKINNPADLRKSRKMDIHFDALSNEH